MSIQLFCGYDPREAVGFHVFVHSVLQTASMDVQFQALDACGCQQGSNAFTLSRFLVPWLVGERQSFAIFADASDMLMKGDIADLAELFDDRYAVQVVKHADYETRHPRKYVGTALECENRNYPRKNWASLMLINCRHPAWRLITPEYLRSAPIKETLQLSFLRDEWIGELPPAWNVLADEGQPVERAQILHWTAGIPGFRKYRHSPAGEQWHAARAQMLNVGA